MADYKIVYTRVLDVQTFLIPNALVSDEWHQRLMQLQGTHDMDFPDLEHLAIMGVVAFFCGERSHLTWAQTVSSMLDDEKLRNEYEIESRDIKHAKAGLAILKAFGTEDNFGRWLKPENPAKCGKGQIMTHRPVWSIEVVFNN